jgi:hypothetical protein
MRIPERLRPAAGLAAALVALALVPAAPRLGPAPDAAAHAGALRSLAAGALCDSCPDPNLRVFGVEFRNGEMWTVSADGTLSRLDGCRTVGIASIQGFRGFATGLGYDSRRDLFVVTDAELDEVDVVDLHGNPVRSYPAPGTGSIGAAYDPKRDLYWITDWEEDSLFAVVPESGAIAARFGLPAGFRVAGAALDPAIDGIYYQSRTATPICYLVSVVDGTLLDSFALPYSGVNGWEDNALGPNGNLWIHHFELRAVYCIERQTTAARPVTWGALKALYR